MRNKWIKPLIGVVIFAVFIAAYLFVSNKNKIEAEQSAENPIKLVDKDKNDISMITIKNSTGEVILQRDGEAWSMVNNEDLSLDESIVNLVTANLSTLEAYKVIDENPGDISMYGLSSPQATVEALLNDNSTIKVNIGDKLTIGEYYYASIGDYKTVYLIHDWAAESFLNPGNYLRDKVVSNIDTEQLESIIIRQKDTPEIEIKKKEEGDGVYYGMGDFIITKPYTTPKPIATEAMIQKILSPLDNLRINEFVNDNQSDIDYSTYGLDEPVLEIIASDSSGNVLNIIFGKDTDDNGIYFKSLLKPNVYSMDKSLVNSFLEVTPFDVVDRFLSLIKIDDIKELTISSNINNSQSQRKVVVTNNDDDTQSFTLDGNETTEEVYRTIQSKASGILYDSQLPEDTNITGTSLINFTYTLMSTNNNIKVDFYDYNNDFYAAGVNGEILYAVNKKTVNDIVELINGL